MEYAPPLKRLIAALIDWVLLLVVNGIIGFVIGLAMGGGEAAQGASSVVGIVIGWVYFAAMESSASQATLGKQAMGLIVTDLEGQPVSFLRATGRHFGKILSGCLLLIGYIMIFFTEKKQGLHDIIAGCLVLQR